EQSLAANPNDPISHMSRYWIAFIDKDQPRLEQEAAWAEGRPQMPMFLIIQATAAASEGRLKESGRIYSTAAGRLQSSDHGTAASMTLGQIVNEEWCGKYDRIEDRVTAVIPNAQGNRDALSMAAIALSLAGRPERARALIDDLAKRYPKDTLVNEV